MVPTAAKNNGNHKIQQNVISHFCTIFELDVSLCWADSKPNLLRDLMLSLLLLLPVLSLLPVLLLVVLWLLL